MTDVNDVINAFNTYRNWFYTLNPTLQIIVAILTIAVTILMIYAVFSLAIALVKAGFWLYAMAFKGMVVGIAVGIYTGVVLCIKIPIAAIKEEPLNYTFDEYKANVVDFATAVFPPKKTESSEDQKIPVCHDHSAHHLEHAEHRLEHAQERLARAQARMERRLGQKIDEKIITQPASKSAYFCANCGHKFTAKMVSLLNTRSNVCCEYCGQRFNIENKIPIPQQSQ